MGTKSKTVSHFAGVGNLRNGREIKGSAAAVAPELLILS